MSTPEFRSAKRVARDAFRANPNVVTIYVGEKKKGGRPTGGTAVVFTVRKKLPKEAVPERELIPPRITGVVRGRPVDVPTDVEEGEMPKALAFAPLATEPLSLTARRRPCPGGYSVGHYCYDDQTRVLTRGRGLQFFKDLSKADEVATLDSNGALIFQRPTAHFAYPYDGTLLRFYTKTFDLSVTPNHSIYYRNRGRSNDSFHLAPAENVVSSLRFDQIEFKRDARWKGRTPEAIFVLPPQSKMRHAYWHFLTRCHEIVGVNGAKQFASEVGIHERTVRRWRDEGRKPAILSRSYSFRARDWLQFLGWYLAEGSCSSNTGNISIAERSGRHHAEILELLSRMDLSGFVSAKKGIGTSCREIALYLRRFGHAKDKYIPEDIKAYSPEYLGVLLQALMRGDGHFEDGKFRHFKTTSWWLANDVLEIALKCGYGVTLTQSNSRSHKLGNRTIPASIAYRVGFSHVKTTPRLCQPVERTHYKGTVYCVEVPNHVIFVERNGKTCWSGNSITAGTLGAWVKRGTSELYHILSNAHVLSNTNSGAAGDAILQPGKYDGGQVGADTIATLTAFVKINFPGSGGGGGKKKCGLFLMRAVKSVTNSVARAVGCPNRLVFGRPLEISQPTPNLVDAAAAAVLDPAWVRDEIEFLGPLAGIRDPKLGEASAKVGRTTELKRGTVVGVDAWSKVDYGPEGVTEFDDQVLFGPGGFSAGGDSGSAILTEDGYLTALLFAGSSTVTLGNRASSVVALLGIRL